MSRKALHVLVLYDLPEITSGHDDPAYLLQHKERPTERDVCVAIQKLGFRLSVFGVFNDVSAIPEVIQRRAPDLVFNLCETFRGDRSHEGNIASLIELTGVPMTGSRPDALHLCKDKATTKKILSYDGVRVPRFSLLRIGEEKLSDAVQFPVIVKPLNREGSEGIAQASVVQDLTSCKERVTYVHDKLKADAIVEEFIHGRELYVGVIETVSGLVALPPRELFMKNLGQDRAMVATYRAKWDDEYREKWGIETAKAGPMPKDIYARLMEDSLKTFKSLGMKGYARIDWRMNADGEPIFLEANPNPALAQNDDFAKAAKTAGYSYQELILHLIEQSLTTKATSAMLRRAQ